MRNLDGRTSRLAALENGLKTFPINVRISKVSYIEEGENLEGLFTNIGEKDRLCINDEGKRFFKGE